MSMYSKGIILEQHKEPALSAPLVTFTNPQNDTFTLDRELPLDSKDYTSEDMIEIARTANIIDETDGRELHLKLKQSTTGGNKVSAIVIDAIDDEPYVSSRLNPLISLREEVVGGIALCEQLTGCDNVQIMVYRHITDLETNIPAMVGDYKVVRMRGGYPARPSAAQVRHLRKGFVLRIGIGAIIHFYRAITYQKIQTSAFITVAGNAVANPMNMEASFDMSVTQVLERCGLAHTPTQVVLGGPMRGFATLDTDRTLITATTKAVLAFTKSEKEYHYNCIGCGRCERHCPVGLNPMYIYQFASSHTYSKLHLYDPKFCINCGTCSYICPSRLNVVGAVQSAKNYLRENPSTVDEYTWADFKALMKRIWAVIKRGLIHTKNGIVRFSKFVWRITKKVAKKTKEISIIVAKKTKVLAIKFAKKTKEIYLITKEKLSIFMAEQGKIRAENAKLRAEKNAKDEMERLEKRKIAAEKAAVEATERLEREKLAAENTAKETAKRLEQEKLAAENTAKETAERLEQEKLVKAKEAADQLEHEKAEKLEAEKLEAEKKLEKENGVSSTTEDTEVEQMTLTTYITEEKEEQDEI